MNTNLAKAFGLTAGRAIDEKLARAMENPNSKCVERYVMSRGLCAIYVSGMYVASIGEAGKGAGWFAERAERVPELPHLMKWAEAIK